MIELSVITAVIIGLAQISKSVGFPAKFIPLLNLAIGIIVFTVFGENELKLNIFNGIIAGLSASGLYSGTKNLIQGVLPVDNGGKGDKDE